MNILVNTSAVLSLKEGTLSTGPEDRHLDILVVYPDDNLLFVPSADEVKNHPSVFEPGDENKVCFVQDEVMMGFYIEEIISITEL